MKKQINQSRQNNNKNLLNLFLVALLIFMTFGCSGFVKDFKKGFNESYDKRKGPTDTTPDSPSKTDGLADDIVGRWEMTTNNKTLAFEFSSVKTVESFVDGKKTSSGLIILLTKKPLEQKMPTAQSLKLFR